MTTPEGNDGRSPSAADEQTFGSTPWEWKKVRISRAPQATVTERRRRSAWWYLPPWPARKPLAIVVKYRGGPEAWVEVRGRGSVSHFPGSTAILDILRQVWQEDRPR